MKQYVTATCALFGLLTLAHVWRLTQEPHLARDPWFLFFTLAAGGLCLWALALLRARRAP
jgi:hypothetical protein